MTANMSHSTLPVFEYRDAYLHESMTAFASEANSYSYSECVLALFSVHDLKRESEFGCHYLNESKEVRSLKLLVVDLSGSELVGIQFTRVELKAT